MYNSIWQWKSDPTRSYFEEVREGTFRDYIVRRHYFVGVESVSSAQLIDEETIDQVGRPRRRVSLILLFVSHAAAPIELYVQVTHFEGHRGVSNAWWTTINVLDVILPKGYEGYWKTEPIVQRTDGNGFVIR